jgi:predicted Zn finger-like uncharacterized protein
MTVSCPDCKSVFRVDPAKVPATGVRARCSVCGGVITIGGGTLPVSVTPASTTAAVVPSGSGHARATPMAAAAFPAPVTAPTAVLADESAEAPAHQSAAASGWSPATSYASVPTPVASVTPMSTPATETARETATESATATPAAGKRPINPFLRADPDQRARRLARALVSDLVAYHPQRREEGLRDGTLRQLFRGEIKKSYEEYVEQVGRDVAEHSPYFQEALNEILAGGRRLF